MLIWIDIETTGLNPQSDKLLEIAAIVTDDKLVEVGRYEGVTDQIAVTALPKVDPFVREMHAKNGLWNESLTVGKSLTTVENGMLDLLYEHCYKGKFGRFDAYVWHPGWPGGRCLRDLYTHDIMTPETTQSLAKNGPQLAGSTVSFDRSFIDVYMPVLAAYLHYRNVDVSSFNELAKRFNKPLFEGRPRDNPDSKHRAMSDIQDSLAVGRYYAGAISTVSRDGVS